MAEVKVGQIWHFNDSGPYHQYGYQYDCKILSVNYDRALFEIIKTDNPDVRPIGFHKTLDVIQIISDFTLLENSGKKIKKINLVCRDVGLLLNGSLEPASAIIFVFLVEK